MKQDGRKYANDSDSLINNLTTLLCSESICDSCLESKCLHKKYSILILACWKETIIYEYFC